MKLRKPGAVWQAEQLPADTDYCSKAILAACEAADVEPFIAATREPHHIG